ncbi:MAG: RHS repeat protein, partial [Firmicutes bacterium]|nr:RHS repeat protein [Bacillota bacterium]
MNTYDHLGNLLTTQDAAGNTITNTYDWLGNLLTTTDAKGNVSSYSYDVLGRILTATTPIDASRNSIVKYAYDPAGNVLFEGQSSGTEMTNGSPSDYMISQYVYDSMNRIIRIYTGIDYWNAYSPFSVNETVSMMRVDLPDVMTSDFTDYDYDLMGNLVSVETGKRIDGFQLQGEVSTTLYTYDQFGNILTMTDPLEKMETYTYDLNGNVLTKTDRNGVTTTYTYDHRGRLTQEVIGSGDAAITRTRTYGLNGSLLSLNEGSNTISYVYDAWGRVTSETNGTQVKSYTYDRGNLRTSFVLTDNGTTRVSNTYTYDNLSRMTGVAGSDGTTAAYTYDANNNLSSITFGNGISQSYTYNKANQITQMVAQDNGETVSSYTYGYDLAGRRISTVDLNGTTTYTYDLFGRLTSETGPNVSNSFTYDTRGKRSTSTKNGVITTYTYDLANRLLSSVTDGVTTTYTYDDNGNTLTSKEGSSSAVQYSYNLANQQTGYTDPNNNITATYSYNPDGLRKNKVVNGITTSYGWDGDDIVMETTAGTPTTFVRGLQLVSNNTGTTAANANYYLHDGHGNVTYLADNSGTITESYHYEAFGEQLNTVTDTNPFQYCGEYIDAETGTYYLRARNYVPTLGRFTQWDSYNGDITVPASLNHYTYCYNDPIGYVDPTGYAAETILDLVSAGVSVKELIEDPSWENLGWLGLDALALGAPFIPASGTVKYLDDAADAGKIVDKGADVVEAIGKAATKRADKIDGVVKNIDEFNGTSIFTGTSRPRN